jgi:hypothetical protein
MTPASDKRYQPHEQGTPCGKMMRVLDTATGRYVSMSHHTYEEARKICDRLNERLRESQERTS